MQIASRSSGRPSEKVETIAAVAAVLGVLIFDTLPGLLIGIGVSLLLLYRTSRPNVAMLGQVPDSAQWTDVSGHPENQALPDVAVLRSSQDCSSPTPTTSTPRSSTRPAGTASVQVVLDYETVPFIDVTASLMLDELTAVLARRGVRMVVARRVGQGRDVLIASGGTAPEYFRTVREAVGALTTGRTRMGKAIGGSPPTT